MCCLREQTGRKVIGFKFTFPYAVLLGCFMHFRKKLKTQLRNSSVSEVQ